MFSSLVFFKTCFHWSSTFVYCCPLPKVESPLFLSIFPNHSMHAQQHVHMNALFTPQISRIVHFTCAPQHLHGVLRLTCENVWKFVFAFSNLWSDIANLDYKCVGYMPLIMGSHRNHRNHSSCYNSYMMETLLKTILSVK